MTSSSRTKASKSKSRGSAGQLDRSLTTAQRIKVYYHLTKPGIIYGNCLTTAAGFLYASSLFDMQLGSWLRFAATIAGTALVIGAACVLNNYIDREIDRKMERTRNRALVTGLIPPRQALWFASILAVIGIGLLAAFTNVITVYVGLIGLYSYVAAYGVAKRRSHWGTLVGSLPGATPVVAGYTAVTGHFDVTALLLFLAMAVWQVPHFYAIAIYRLKEYTAAAIPVLPAIKGVYYTKQHMVGFIAAFALSCAALFSFGYASRTFLVIMVVLGLVWLFKAIRGLPKAEQNVDDAWARRMFGFSLAVLLMFSVLLAANSLLP